ncbi:hypothetical protein [Sphingobacterium sp. SYP-B4668]|uniref:hypothetical protein n=1 Tax=Sphingobacterium sp. SYP-B4668 TaxID=2996035 RepID=UPI0022DE79FB|nr:hypothetical protein [Sphingobacterium sp. SYP-B4668]
MKYILLVIFFIFFQTTDAQEEKKVEVFEKPENAKPFQPNDKLCFDYQVVFSGVFNGRPTTGCFFINIEIGAVLSFGFDQATQSGCNYDFQSKDFNAYLYTLKGNTYTYYNNIEREPRSKIETINHYVRTGNTESASPENMYVGKKFYHKDHAKEFGGAQFKGQQYVSDNGDMSIFVLVDENFPDMFESYQFLGAYGIGFIHTSKGTYLVLGYQQDKTESAIVDLKKIAGSECFLAANFRKEELTRTSVHLDETDEYSMDIEKNIAKAKVLVSSCAALKLKFHEEQKRQNDEKATQLHYLKTNKVDYKNQKDLQKAYGKYDPFAVFVLMRMEEEYKLCQIDEYLSRELDNIEEVNKAIKRKQCLFQKVTKLKAIESKVASAKHAYRNDDRGWKAEQKKSLMAIHQTIKEHPCN